MPPRLPRYTVTPYDMRRLTPGTQYAPSFDAIRHTLPYFDAVLARYDVIRVMLRERDTSYHACRYATPLLPLLTLLPAFTYACRATMPFDTLAFRRHAMPRLVIDDCRSFRLLIRYADDDISARYSATPAPIRCRHRHAAISLILLFTALRAIRRCR